MSLLRYILASVGLIVLGLLIGHATGYAFDTLRGAPVDTDFDAGFWAALMVSRSWRHDPWVQGGRR